MLSPVRRTAAAIVATLALLLTGLPASATTAAPSATATSISGHVVLPPGTHTSVAVELRTHGPGGSPIDLATVGADRRFEFTGLTPGVAYELVLESGVRGYVGGYYAGEGVALTGDDAGALAVFAGSNVTLELVKAGEIRGTFTRPPGFAGTFELIRFRLFELSADGTRTVGVNNTWVSDRVDGMFRLFNVRPGVDHVLIVDDADSPDRFPAGYYHVGVDALVSIQDHGTLLRAGDFVDVAIGSALAVPKVSVIEPPTVSGDAKVGQTLTAAPGRWSMSGLTLARQWLRDGATIPGATGSTYTLVPADAGAKVAVRVTATKSGLGSANATSSPTTAVAKASAPRATVAPQLSGSTRLGATLRATAGSWDVSGVTVTYQWLRGSTEINGATSAKYKLKKADVGTRVSVRVTATAAGRVPGVAPSSAVKVRKGKPKVTVKAKSVKAKKRARVVVRVKMAGLAKPTGTVQVKYGKKTVKVKLKAKAKGKLTVRLPKLAKGKYRIKVTYTPNAKSKKFVTKAASKKITLRIR